MSELIVRTRDNKPNIIGITEVKPKANRYKPSTAEYSIPEVGNYKMSEKNIKSDEGRGLLMYVDSNLEATGITMKTEFQENLSIKVKLNQNDKLLVGLIYRTPSNSSKEYNDKLVDLMSEATDMGYSHILIMGDFDYPEINWITWNTKGDRPNSTENKFLEALQDNFLYQHTTKPTRWRGADTPHTLDLLITNEEEMISNLEYMSPLGKGDHCVLSFDFNCYVNIKRAPKIANLYNHGNYKEFIQELNKIDWHIKLNAENSIDKNWNYFLTILKELESRFVPTKTMTQIGKKRNVFPIDKKTRELIRRKNILSKKIITKQDPETRAEYNKVRNQAKTSVNKQKKLFEKGLSENAKRNPKAIWSYIKSKSKTKEGIGDLHVDTEDVKSEKNR
ncbi:uncharacterized protein [Mytilus edulis]|uniref:uncharacterized protein n=1 Tax=Mytilus edulis TaxID=6550 RepID=UPI0039EF6E89